ncbi:protein croquemort [Anabrus simplex]|uniref:protein croquemort n=1 Tax=Anabrus simplex TaxID=316456 RepID=UPI0035A380D6
MEGRWRYTGAVIAVVTGVVLTATGCTLSFMWSNVFDAIVRKELTISPSSKSYQIWKYTPVPMTLEFYFFNWTNPEDIRKPGTKPNLVQMGPYVFTEVHEKVNLTWNPNNTISYKQIRRWYFDAERSNGSLDDEVTTLNVVALTAAFVSRDWSFYLLKSMSIAMSSYGETLAITRTAGELLFEGYSSPLITMANVLPGISGMDIPYDKFGWFYMRNGSVDYDGQFTMHTGTDDISLLGKLSRWNGGNTTKFFPGPCGHVNGSAGELWPPRRTKEDTVAMFSPDLCRSIEFQYLDEQTVHGISGYRYSGGADLLDNKTDCFCGGQCVPSGALNVSTCRYGAPAFVSYPHFYLADPFYLRQVDGLQPEPDKHRFYITLEPETGIPLDVAARFQINILLQPHDYVSMLSGLPRVFFPVLWFQERASMTADMAVSLGYLLLLPSIGLVVSLLMVAFGVLAILVASVAIVKRRRTPRKDDWTSGVQLESMKMQTMISRPDPEPEPEEERLINGTAK